VEDCLVIASIFIDTARSAFSGIIPAGWLARLSLDSAASWNGVLRSDDHSTFLAEEDGVAVGFAIGGPTRDAAELRAASFPLTHGPLPSDAYDWELQAIFLDDRAQRAGWGRRLVASVATDACARGKQSLVVWTLRDNVRGRAFYERLGGTAIDEQMHDFDGTLVPEVCYGWHDVEQLTSRRKPS
jgi:GNAT superfamily N-acetyltransferase